jgi:hypothetical protein
VRDGNDNAQHSGLTTANGKVGLRFDLSFIYRED